MTTLSNAEKKDIIDQHVRTVDYSIYNVELEVLTANAVSSPDTQTIAALNARLSDLNAKRTALLAEKDLL